MNGGVWKWLPPLLILPMLAEGGGRIEGKVLLKGGGVAPRRVPISADQPTCGSETHSESLLVGSVGEVANVVVFVRGAPEGGRVLDRQKSYAVDQRHCRFRPHILLVPMGGIVMISNSDRILHSVRTESHLNPPLNRSQLAGASPLRIKFDRPEIIRYRCELHPWMEGWIVVQAHPYYTLTDSRGRYELTDLPAGVYTVAFWHETLGEFEKKASVREGETTRMEVVYGGLK